MRTDRPDRPRPTLAYIHDARPTQLKLLKRALGPSKFILSALRLS